MPQRGVTLHSEREISFLKFSSLKCLRKRKGNICSKETEKEKKHPQGPLRAQALISWLKKKKTLLNFLWINYTLEKFYFILST